MTASPNAFALALDRALRREPNLSALHRDLKRQGLVFNRTTLRVWRCGLKVPTHARSFEILAALER
ncbi:hypothetical protein, partial [Phenylobacterium sp.]|uniref:hypothetical protein n=1 Tax=Phenylobacterium sp. TaxID=1871053 RepID=UPI002F3E3F2E